MLRALKTAVFGDGIRPHRIRSGAFDGLHMKLDARVETQVILGTCEREVQPELVRSTRGIRAALDVGAAHGLYTLYFLKRTSAEQVIAVEPDAASRAVLLENLALNQLAGDARVSVVAGLVASSDWGGDTALASLLAPLPRPVFVKMDVEGYEANILGVEPGVVADPGVRWLIELHGPERAAECSAIFNAARRAFRIIRPAWWRAILPEQRSNDSGWLVSV